MMNGYQEQVIRAFEDSRGDVYRYLLTFGLSPPQAQEAAQEVFLRLHIALEKGDVIQNTRAWIFRVAHNLGIEMRSKDQPLPMEPKIERAFRDTARGVELDLIQRERMDQLSRTWKTLSAQQW